MTVGVWRTSRLITQRNGAMLRLSNKNDKRMGAEPGVEMLAWFQFLTVVKAD